MDFIFHNTFQKSLERLNNEEQKQAKITAMDLQLNPASPGHQFHKVERAKDKRFWTVRINRDLRIVVYRDDSRLVLCYVDHHDKAYNWAQKRKYETHPVTGSAQFVEIRERVEEVVKIVEVEEQLSAQKEHAETPAIQGITDAELLAYGIPDEWLVAVKEANEDFILEVAERLPPEAQEAVLKLAVGEIPDLPTPFESNKDPFSHPDAQRSFRIMNDVDELQAALDFPWERWIVFLHPLQRRLVERDFNGPARISGSAGTGKTIVALHRAVFLAKNNPETRILLTTFSGTLANSLSSKLRRLLRSQPRLGEQIEIHSMEDWAKRLFETNFAKSQLATPEMLDSFISESFDKVDGHSFHLPFVKAEWAQIVDAWQLQNWDDYRDFKRLGRKTRISKTHRESLWKIFSKVKAKLAEKNLITPAERFTKLSSHFIDKRSPYDFMVVDEAQDIDVSQLKLLAALSGNRKNSLFLCGDLGQRIFQSPFSWKALGVNIQGRSSTLKINYRTSHQIRTQADMLLDTELSDLDGNTENRRGTVSVFNGSKPEIVALKTEQAEIETVANWLNDKVQQGAKPREIGVFVRSKNEIHRAEYALKQAGIDYHNLDSKVDPTSGKASVSIMHLAKGLEFKIVVVMACDEDIMPSQERIETASDEAELEDIYNTERHLLYVACTRARDYLLVTCVEPGSEFLLDMR
jgi:mRNA-degrading endonuclease RelE of RelBE toxin-antitoxin system